MKRRVLAGPLLGLAVLVVLDPGTGIAMSSEPGPLRASPAAAAVSTGAATDTVLTSDRNPAKFGHPVRLTVLVRSAGAIPTGTVDVMDGVTQVCADVPLGPDGIASCSVRLLPEAHPLTAVYSGEADFLPSTSAPLAQTVRAR